MKKKLKDRHLDIPSEANRDKHINFVALERNDDDPSDVPATGKLAEEQDIKKANEQKKNTKKKD
jgi:hypothetical protein